MLGTDDARLHPAAEVVVGIGGGFLGEMLPQVARAPFSKSFNFNWRNVSTCSADPDGGPRRCDQTFTGSRDFSTAASANSSDPS